MFQLIATGQPFGLDMMGVFGEKTIASRRVFTSREDAEVYRSEFKRIATRPIVVSDEGYLLDDGRLKIRIVELEL